MVETFIPHGTVKRMLKELFPEDRVSSDAIDRLIVVAEDFLRMTYLDARKFSDASGRKTIMEKDVILSTT